MSAIASALQTIQDLGGVKQRLRATWMTGNYGQFARYMERGAEEFYAGLAVAPGVKVLDVACGAGQIALIAARAGAKVTGCDIALNWLEQARERAAAENLAIVFEEGDAEALPYAEIQFDVVTSLFGAMFAPQPELVAKELTRACRAGGAIAMGNWTLNGFVGKMFQTISKYIAPSGMPSPVLWGDESVVRERLREGIADVRCTLRKYPFEYPFRPEDVVEFFRQNYGPMTRAFASLDAEGQANLRNELTNLWSAHNQAAGGNTLVESEYLEVVATRR